MILPEGYQLDNSPAMPQAGAIPQGYVLDATGPSLSPLAETSALGAAGRGAVGMLPLGKQAYAAIAGAAENKPYTQELTEWGPEIEADIANHPGARLAGQAAGIVAPALVTGGASLPGGVLTEGAAFGAGFGVGNAIDTLATGGSGAKAAGDIALGTLAGGAGGAAGKVLGNVIEKVAKPFIPSQDEIMAEAVNKIFGGTARQVRNLPGKNPAEALIKLGKSANQFRINGEPLIAVTDQLDTRLNKFLALQDQSGKTIGDTIEKAGVEPMKIQPLVDELGSATKFATPDDQAQMQAVIKELPKYADANGGIPFNRLQQLKTDLGDRAFQGEGSPALMAAWHTISNIQDQELEKLSSTINKPEFDIAKNAYHLSSKVIPMLRMAVSKDIASKTSLLVPGAAMLAGHPLVAAGALAKNRLAQMGGAAAFKGIQALPEGIGAMASALPGKIGGQVAGYGVKANTETPVPQLNINHPALAQWRPMFQKNAESAKNPGENEKANAITDYKLSQRDPAYAAAKQRMADNPNDQEPIKMAEGGVVAGDETNAQKELRQSFGSTLAGLGEQLRHPTHEAKPEPLPAKTTVEFHQPFNPDFADKLKAFLEEQNNVPKSR